MWVLLEPLVHEGHRKFNVGAGLSILTQHIYRVL